MSPAAVGERDEQAMTDPRRDDRERAARIRRSAWVLAVVAVAFYLAFIAWNLWRSAAGF